jgi:hypothetical protein
MNRTLLIVTLFAALIAGCRRAAPATARTQTNADVQTIDSANLQPATIDPPPMLTDEAPPLKPVVNVAQADAPPPPTPQDEALRASLPFSPAIAMDPSNTRRGCSRICESGVGGSGVGRAHLLWATTSNSRRPAL